MRNWINAIKITTTDITKSLQDIIDWYFYITDMIICKLFSYIHKIIFTNTANSIFIGSMN